MKKKTFGSCLLCQLTSSMVPAQIHCPAPALSQSLPWNSTVPVRPEQGLLKESEHPPEWWFNSDLSEKTSSKRSHKTWTPLNLPSTANEPWRKSQHSGKTIKHYPDDSPCFPLVPYKVFHKILLFLLKAVWSYSYSQMMFKNNPLCFQHLNVNSPSITLLGEGVSVPIF